MRALIIAMALAGCAGELPEISEHTFGDAEIREYGQEETVKVITVRNRASYDRTFHLKCYNMTEYVSRWMPFYRFDVFVKARSETRFQAEYPVKVKHQQMCEVEGRTP